MAGFALAAFGFGLVVAMLLPGLGLGDDFVSTRATYYASPNCFMFPSSGACGYGEFGRNVNDGNVAGVSRLWKNDTGCGDCYQVRCKAPNVCSDDGLGRGRPHGLHPQPTRLRKDGASQLRAGAVQVRRGGGGVHYKRIPCRYAGYNIVFKVKEHSKYPDYLAGQYDVTAVDIWQEDCKQWRGMRRAYGAVFDVVTPPKCELRVRFQLVSSVETTWLESKIAIPGEWKAGATYDSNVQLN
ncbi:unnamed protein product [Linum trigynum]|uniref:Expansin-like EG45 domain-containing protein n=1 Tax=Linum trigynum TaxID=586398 RepID=A0AAV2FUU4_9ROSI